MPLYTLHYQYQVCMDDGGIGHDMWWAKGTYDFVSEDDGLAVKEASDYIKDHDGKHPCHGSFCDNKGGYKFVSLEGVVPEVRVKIK